MGEIIEHRVTRLEDGVDRLGETLDRHSENTNRKLDDIATLLTVLVRVDERQTVIGGSLLEGKETMKDHETRLKNIEVAMPGLKEKSRWMVIGVLGVLGVLGTEILTRLFK